MKKPSRKVSYTITLKWTLKEATDFHRKEGTLNDRPLREFLESLENDAIFSEFMDELIFANVPCSGTKYEHLQEDYFHFVADQL